MPKVSVIVPIYNPGKYIEPLLKTIVNQTLKDIEILLVDNGSTDGTRKILEDYRDQDDRIHLFFRSQEGENCGEKYAVDLARKNAKGEYIIVCDHDDELYLDALEKLYNASEGKADAVKGSAVHVYNNVEYERPAVTAAATCISSWERLDKRSRFMHFLWAPELWSILIRKDFMDTIELGDYIFNDTDFVFKIKYLAKDFRYIADPVYKWNIHMSSTSHNQDKYYYELIKVYDSLERFLKDDKANPDIWEIFAYSRFYAYTWLYTGLSDEKQKIFLEYFKRDMKRDFTIRRDEITPELRQYYDILNIAECSRGS